MSAQAEKLQALLARVQARAAEPRAAAVAAAPAPSLELDEPHIDDQAEDISLDAPALGLAPELEESSQEQDSSDFETPSLERPQFDASKMEAPELDTPEVEFSDSDDDFDEVEVDELDEVEFEEEAPESGEISSSSSSLDDDLLDEEPAPLTAPPESGEEEAKASIPAHEGPTMEQLGETISLDESGDSGSLELDEPILEEPEATQDDSSPHLEAELPASASMAPENLQSPDGAQEELERHRLGDSTPIEARVSVRPVLSTNVVDLVSSSREFAPKSFVELLDASLALK